MILGGANIETQSLAKDEQSALSVAQLILFNYRSGRKTGPLTNHSTDREPPLPVYLGMKIHAETRKKGLVDTLYSLGLSISYDRLLSISTALGNSAIDQYEEDGVVCPRKLRSGVFTTSAVDNIDHNPSSTTSQGSLHGTAISVFQHPRPGSEGKLREREFSQEKLVTNDRTVSKLPDTYTTVLPVQYRKHPPLPLDYLEGLNVVRVDNINCLEKEKSWLEHALRILESRDEGTSGHQTLSWSAYHASHSFTQQADVSVLLPLFQEQPQSVAMIRHAMDIVKDTTSFLNPGQLPVLTCDQPLYAIAKEIQWIWPDMYGESKFVIVLGGLHIEIAALKAIGKWLEDTGWTEVIVKGGVATEGTADSFLRAAHVTRTRHAHQVTAVSLYILLRRAYDLYACTSRNDVEQPLEFEPWIIKRESESPQFKFWYITLQFELLILLFVRSLREGNFQTYKDSLSQLIPWFFSLDKPNYARWLSVHIRDMISLDTLHPAVKREFEDGKFVVNKTGRGFSSIALDHAHEQNNKLVKGDGGAIGLTENSTQLLRWMVCGPEVARVIQEFHTLLDGSKGEAVKSHHEELPSVQRNFKSQVHGLCDAICESGNPFTDESSDLLVLGSRDILPSNVVDTVDKIYLEGEKQYNAFVEERFRKREKSLYDPIHQNKFALFNSPSPREVAKEKQHITSLKQNCSLFSQLYIACQVRDGDLDDFFRHENQDTPPSLSQYGSLRTGSKSDLIQCLESGLRVQEEPSNIDMLLIDGAALVNMLLPRGAKTFLEYAETVFIPYIISQLSRVQRIDIIWDVYESNSLKHSTRVRRGKGLRRRVMSDTTLPGNWSLFLRDNENKEELFVFLADELTKIQCDKDVISTYGSNILHNLYDETAVEHLSPCSHEEADTRILLHMADASRKGFSKVAIRTVDTDVLVLTIAAFHQLSITEIWLIFGTGLNLRFIPVHDIAQELGEEKSSCIHVFHALTGCDQTSFFSGRGKKSAWQTWSTYPALTSALQMISKTPSDADLLTSLPTFERFTVLLYDKTSNCLTTDEARKDLFTRKGRSMEGIPPTSAALLQHLKRVVYQAGFVWGQALTKNPTLPLPSDWGWRLNQCNRWEPLWTILDSASESCKELIRCGCNPSIGCKGRCKCLKAEMACTALCKCGGQCDRG